MDTEKARKNKIEKLLVLGMNDRSAGGRRNFNYPKAQGNGILRMYLGKIFSGQIFAPGGTMPLGGLSES